MNVEQPKQQVFKELENHLAALEPEDAFKMGRDRWILLILLLGVSMTGASILGAGREWSSWIGAAGVLVELCALGVFTYRQVCDVVPDFIDAKRKFAEELDGHFAHYEHIRSWLRSLGTQDRRRRLAYLESRLESFGARYPILFGAADKLGVLPALLGVFLQWQAIKTVSLATGIFGLMVVALYGMALWMTRFRLQLQSYARLLKAADSD